MNWGECYYNHYESFLGQPVDRHIFRQSLESPSLQILAYDRVFKDCRVFCSLGLTHFVPELQKVGEVIVVADNGWEDIPFLAANSLFFMIQNHMNLGWGIGLKGIGNIKPEFVKKFGKDALYFSRPYGFPEQFNQVSCNSDYGFLIMAGIISEKEYNFFVANGAKKFEELMERESVDLFALNRMSCL